MGGAQAKITKTEVELVDQHQYIREGEIPQDRRYGTDVRIYKQISSVQKVAILEKQFNSEIPFQATLDIQQRVKELNHQGMVNLVNLATKTKDIWCTKFFKLKLLYEYVDSDLEENITSRKQIQKELTSFNETQTNTFFYEEEIWYILATVAAVLSYLGQHQVLHGDVRPSTLCLTQEGNLKLVGVKSLIQTGWSSYLEKLEGMETSSTYISPIQLKGLQHKVRQPNQEVPKSDIFCLGVIALECCLLENVQDIYDFNQFKVDTSKRMAQLRNCNRYSEHLITTISYLLEIEESGRPSPEDLYEKILSLAHEEKIQIYSNIDSLETAKDVLNTYKKSVEAAAPQANGMMAQNYQTIDFLGGETHPSEPLKLANGNEANQFLDQGRLETAEEFPNQEDGEIMSQAALWQQQQQQQDHSQSTSLLKDSQQKPEEANGLNNTQNEIGSNQKKISPQHTWKNVKNVLPVSLQPQNDRSLSGHSQNGGQNAEQQQKFVNMMLNNGNQDQNKQLKMLLLVKQMQQQKLQQQQMQQQQQQQQMMQQLYLQQQLQKMQLLQSPQIQNGLFQPQQQVNPFGIINQQNVDPLQQLLLGQQTSNANAFGLNPLNNTFGVNNMNNQFAAPQNQNAQLLLAQQLQAMQQQQQQQQQLNLLQAAASNQNLNSFGQVNAQPDLFNPYNNDNNIALASPSFNTQLNNNNNNFNQQMNNSGVGGGSHSFANNLFQALNKGNSGGQGNNFLLNALKKQASEQQQPLPQLNNNSNAGFYQNQNNNITNTGFFANGSNSNNTSGIFQNNNGNPSPFVSNNNGAGIFGSSNSNNNNNMSGGGIFGNTNTNNNNNNGGGGGIFGNSNANNNNNNNNNTGGGGIFGGINNNNNNTNKAGGGFLNGLFGAAQTQ